MCGHQKKGIQMEGNIRGPESMTTASIIRNIKELRRALVQILGTKTRCAQKLISGRIKKLQLELSKRGERE